jgi:hypothetical protein
MPLLHAPTPMHTEPFVVSKLRFLVRLVPYPSEVRTLAKIVTLTMVEPCSSMAVSVWWFKNHLCRSAAFTQPLTEMCTISGKIIFLESRARPVRRADNLTAISETIV